MMQYICRMFTAFSKGDCGLLPQMRDTIQLELNTAVQIIAMHHGGVGFFFNLLPLCLSLFSSFSHIYYFSLYRLSVLSKSDRSACTVSPAAQLGAEAAP